MPVYWNERLNMFLIGNFFFLFSTNIRLALYNIILALIELDFSTNFVTIIIFKSDYKKGEQIGLLFFLLKKETAKLSLQTGNDRLFK